MSLDALSMPPLVLDNMVANSPLVLLNLLLSIVQSPIPYSHPASRVQRPNPPRPRVTMSHKAGPLSSKTRANPWHCQLEAVPVNRAGFIFKFQPFSKKIVAPRNRISTGR